MEKFILESALLEMEDVVVKALGLKWKNIGISEQADMEEGLEHLLNKYGQALIEINEGKGAN